MNSLKMFVLVISRSSLDWITNDLCPMTFLFFFPIRSVSQELLVLQQ